MRITLRSTLLGLVTAGTLAGTTLLYVSVERSARALDPTPDPVVPTIEVQSTLHRLSLDPESLAAAGLSAGETEDVVQNVLDYLWEHPNAINQAVQAASQATAECTRLERLVRSGLASQQNVADCVQARGSADLAQATSQSVANTLFGLAVADLSNSKRQTLATIRENRRHWNQPVAYLAMNMTDAERLQLRDALSNERIATARDTTPDQAAQSFLASIRSQQAVATAQANLDTALPLIQAAWTDAAGAD